MGGGGGVDQGEALVGSMLELPVAASCVWPVLEHFSLFKLVNWLERRGRGVECPHRRGWNYISSSHTTHKPFISGALSAFNMPIISTLIFSMS